MDLLMLSRGGAEGEERSGPLDEKKAKPMPVPQELLVLDLEPSVKMERGCKVSWGFRMGGEVMNVLNSVGSEMEETVVSIGKWLIPAFSREA